MFIAVIILLIVILGIAVIFIPKNVKNKEGFVKINISGAEINAEIADERGEIERGLMYQESMGEKEGMLFIFDKEKETNFWMKNTLIPLDIIFLDENKEIVNIAENAVPCKTEECALYPSQFPVKYAIEVNAGFVDKKGIKLGEKAEF